MSQENRAKRLENRFQPECSCVKSGQSSCDPSRTGIHYFIIQWKDNVSFLLCLHFTFTKIGSTGWRTRARSWGCYRSRTSSKNWTFSWATSFPSSRLFSGFSLSFSVPFSFSFPFPFYYYYIFTDQVLASCLNQAFPFKPSCAHKTP